MADSLLPLHLGPRTRRVAAVGSFFRRLLLVRANDHATEGSPIGPNDNDRTRTWFEFWMGVLVSAPPILGVSHHGGQSLCGRDESGNPDEDDFIQRDAVALLVTISDADWRIERCPKPSGESLE